MKMTLTHRFVVLLSLLLAVPSFAGPWLGLIFKKTEFENHLALDVKGVHPGSGCVAAGIVADIVGKILGIGWFVWIARLYMIFKGVSNVAKGEKKPLPYIGNLIK